jgi:hypothetical protein
MADTIKATPRNRTLGSLVNAYDKTLGPLLNKYEILPQIPLIGGMTLGSLGANQVRNIANEMSYGNYQPVRNARNIQTMTIDPDTLDVASMIPFGGIAAKVGKPVAKALGRGAAERVAQHMDAAGLNQYIVPPEGNLNFTTRLDEQIRGPETQTVYDLLKQVQGKPGVTKEGLKQLAAMYPDSAAKITKEEFKKNIPASRYDKVDLRRASEDSIEHYRDLAENEIQMEDALLQHGVPENLMEDVTSLQMGFAEFSDLDPVAQREISRIYGVDSSMDPSDISSTLEDINYQIYHEAAYERALDLHEEAMGAGANAYPYEDVQRLVSSKEPHDYFEFGVTHPSQTGEYRHYSSGDSPEGLIGHVRGSYAATEPLTLEGGISTKPNSYVVEEIQSDAQKGAEQTGPLHQVHGTLFKSAIQDAAEKGADYVYLPTSNPIAAVRGKRGEDYSSIYDQAVIKEGLDPLRKIPGIEINPINQKILNGMLEFDEMPMYHEIKLSPEARESILSGSGQASPGLGNVEYKARAISTKAPESHPFIGYMSKDGKMEKFNEAQAREADYHHSNLVKDLDAYDSDDALKFVRNNSENVYTIRGNAAIMPHATESKEQLSTLAKQLVDSGADPSAPFQIEHMALPQTEAPYQGKSIGTLKDWIEGTHGFAAGGLVASDYDDESISQMADDLLGYGNRETGEAKGKGALGEIRMPDGRDVMTEYSINVDGREMPSIVEGMHPADVNYIRETGIVPEDAIATAIRSANRREAEGKSAFYAKGGAVKNPFANMSYADKFSLLYEGGKKRFGKYYDEANDHGAYPDDLSGRLKTKYAEQLGNSRENRTPLDVAINYGGGYDFGARKNVAPEDARQMAKAYQLLDYMTSFRKKEINDAIQDYYENMQGVEAGIAGRGKGRMPESGIEEASRKYGLSKATAAPVYSEKGYAQGGLVYNDEEINNLANQLLGA